MVLPYLALYLSFQNRQNSFRRSDRPPSEQRDYDMEAYGWFSRTNVLSFQHTGWGPHRGPARLLVGRCGLCTQSVRNLRRAKVRLRRLEEAPSRATLLLMGGGIEGGGGRVVIFHVRPLSQTPLGRRGGVEKSGCRAALVVSRRATTY